jgi:ArsR family transcriptional regulator
MTHTLAWSILTSVYILAIMPAMNSLPLPNSHAPQARRAPSDCCGEDDADARRYPETEEAARLFRVLADETRLAILRQLRDEGEVCACDFRACCRLAQPTVSHHLRILREAGLVATEKRGLWVHYRLNESALERLRRLLP